MIAKTWKQHKYPLREEWIKKMWYKYTMEYYSAIKNETMPFATRWMDLGIIILSEVSQTVRDKHHMVSLTCGIYKKKGSNELIFRTKTDSQTEKLKVTKGDRWGEEGMDQGLGIGICTLKYME